MRGGAGAGSCSPGPATTGDIVTHRREADCRPSAAAAAAILSRYRLSGSGQNIFMPRHVKMLLRGPVGLLLPTPPRHCNSSNNNNSSGGGVQRLVPIFLRAVYILRTIAGRMDALSPPSLSSHVSCIIYGTGVYKLPPPFPRFRWLVSPVSPPPLPPTSPSL